jgi:DNA mismatch repair protein MutL
MENSLDAGAKHIHITLMNGGLELIKIKDNGSGIQVRNNTPTTMVMFA